MYICIFPHTYGTLYLVVLSDGTTLFIETHRVIARVIVWLGLGFGLDLRLRMELN